MVIYSGCRCVRVRRRAGLRRTCRRRSKVAAGGGRPMKVSILDDYCDTLRTLDCFAKLDGHDVTVWTDHTDDLDVLASRLHDADALVLIRERTAVRAPLLERL